MITLFIPSKAAVLATANSVGHITDGLDAVVIENHYDPTRLGIVLLLAGNDRDLGLATERAQRIGGTVD